MREHPSIGKHYSCNDPQYWRFARQSGLRREHFNRPPINWRHVGIGLLAALVVIVIVATAIRHL